ncbi:HAD-IIIA family hydrolase [Piscinibacter sp. HJYY11]|uniref:D-glycero-alpha-D-manno-heptose-1,7-bisphosphate 7-phosphatase n=1 Tax=Piscinibacter sp. HJYY11 TaxID=2801333 RepID=UPI00191DACBE|nr:HAD family hydrolase [Piscinibacter sp. HJYY11]MBL0727188.1 HAD family hydrolase [Piscinibacter sp. HJYY11]
MPEPNPRRRRAVFIDKDGTLVENVPYNVDPSLVTFTPHAMQGLRLLSQHGYPLVVVSNQPGVALGYFDEAALAGLRMVLMVRLASHGVRLAGFRCCPHAPDAGCSCRKPAPGLLLQAAADLDLDLQRSWMVGDILDDVEAGHRAGCRSVLLDVGNETQWKRSPLREPEFRVANLLEAAETILAADHVMSASPRETT